MNWFYGHKFQREAYLGSTGLNGQQFKFSYITALPVLDTSSLWRPLSWVLLYMSFLPLNLKYFRLLLTRVNSHALQGIDSCLGSATLFTSFIAVIMSTSLGVYACKWNALRPVQVILDPWVSILSSCVKLLVPSGCMLSEVYLAQLTSHMSDMCQAQILSRCNFFLLPPFFSNPVPTCMDSSIFFN